MANQNMNNYPNNGFIFSEPQCPEQVVEKIKQRGRICVPSRSGAILDLIVERICAPATVDGHLVTAYIVARRTTHDRPKAFALIIGDKPKPLSMPILWLCSLNATGQWIL